MCVSTHFCNTSTTTSTIPGHKVWVRRLNCSLLLTWLARFWSCCLNSTALPVTTVGSEVGSMLTALNSMLLAARAPTEEHRSLVSPSDNFEQGEVTLVTGAGVTPTSCSCCLKIRIGSQERSEGVNRHALRRSSPPPDLLHRYLVSLENIHFWESHSKKVSMFQQ